MSTTPNLLISYIQAAQNQKEVTANAAFLSLEEALTDNTSIAMTDADYTFSAVQGSPALTNIVFIFTGTLTQPRHVILPPNAKLYIVMNGTGSSGSPVTPNEPLIFKAGSGVSTVTIVDERFHLIYCDGGNNVYEISGKNTETIAAGQISIPNYAVPAYWKSPTFSFAASGVIATDNVMLDFNGDPTSSLGFNPSPGGMLTIIKFCTAGFVNIILVNNTSEPIIPNGQSSPLVELVLNFRVIR